MTRAITPGNANNALIIDVCIQFSGSLANEYVTAALFQDSTANALKCATRHIQSGAYMTSGDVIWFRHVMTAGTTSSTIFKVRIGSSASDSILTVNGESLTRRMGGVYCTSITIMEVKA
jgi:hypothetical protein